LFDVDIFFQIYRDGDGIEASRDNCDEVANGEQLDTDGDGIGKFLILQPLVTIMVQSLKQSGTYHIGL